MSFNNFMITLNIRNIKTGICLGFTQSEKKKASTNQNEHDP